MEQDQVKLVQIDSQTSETAEIGQKLMALCAAASQDSLPMAKNISDINWQKRPETLLYCLFLEKRFDKENGCLYGLILNDILIAVSGIYRSDFNPEHIAVGGVRTYTREEYRNRFWHGEYLIPGQIEWAKKNGLSQVIFSFNEESSPLRRFLLRAKSGKATALGLEPPSIYKNLIEHPRPILLKNKLQQILKLNLRPGFEWDYTKLEHGEG